MPHLLSGRHQFGFLAGTGITIVRVCDDEDFSGLETLVERRVQPLQTGNRQRSVMLEQFEQHLGERHASGDDKETRFQ
ncbi:hypothetical protein D3C73_1335380 [compost metagenome]